MLEKSIEEEREMKVGVLLSGCGLGDGSQVEEVMLTYLALDKYGIDYTAIAPDKLQFDVINHMTEKEQNEGRNILIESARIGRGRIKNLKMAMDEELDALILPGGLGVFKNLSDYIIKRENFKVDESVKELICKFYKAKKPVLGICGSVILIPKSLEGMGKRIKIATTNNAYENLLASLNCELQNCKANEIVFDKENKVISTPAFLASQNMNEVYEGIDRMIKKLIREYSLFF
jgi:enhancing lycopene biosynthesis protein 2